MTVKADDDAPKTPLPVVSGDPKPEKVKKDEEIKWISCRASRGCEGKEAKLAMKWKQRQGGGNLRFVCTTCNKPFHVNY